MNSLIAFHIICVLRRLTIFIHLKTGILLLHVRDRSCAMACRKIFAAEEFALAAAIFCGTAAFHGLLILNFRMRERSVLGWRPRRLAAPCGPSIRQLQAARARMM